MSDSDDSERPPTPEAASNPPDANATENTIEKARKFLRDEKVKNSSVEKVTQFLEGQGLDKDQIQKLLLEEFEQDVQSATPPPTTATTTNESSSKEERSEPEQEQAVVAKENKDVEASPSTASSSTNNNSPPIITYPEFLTTSPRPPPLLTPTRLANILAVSGSIWTALYGISRCVVNPMAETLHESRTEYYSHVSTKLGQLVEKLEDVVSEVPYKNGRPLIKSSASKHDDVDEVESTFSDPTELFHRDVGTQTSPRLQPEDSSRPNTSGGRSDTSNSNNNNNNNNTKPVDAQVRRVAALRASVRELGDMQARRAANSADLNAEVRAIRDEVDKLGTPPSMTAMMMNEYASSSSSSSWLGPAGYGRAPEPDDEVKKAKDAIRSVKGMFLSTRSFPTAVVR
ncbi:hypothetical protein GGR53DRAFT_484700 [Hypoxylon sp. FL1150]|nr:hypothetical protein GGR53DRAFT_484700 [Hypoxylon sp. FL1150]